MDYFAIRNLKQEPFSNSPDPDFFFESTVHLACLQQIEIAVRLHRGLNVVMGDVGTGKTTLCRQLIRRFLDTPEDRSEVETHLLLDAAFGTAREFLATLAALFGAAADQGQSEWQIKESIKNLLFQKGVDENRTVVLIIDEGQKLTAFCLEILRELLNYDTNDKKLLQIVIFAQNEFRQRLGKHPNFADRVNHCYLLGPLNYRETGQMIGFRLARAGYEGPTLFTRPALWALWRATGGYPRRIITLCHHVLLAMIIRDKKRAGWGLVSDTVRKLTPEQGRPRRLTATTAALTGILLAAFLVLLLLPAPKGTLQSPRVPPPGALVRPPAPPAGPALQAKPAGKEVAPAAAVKQTQAAGGAEAGRQAAPPAAATGAPLAGGQAPRPSAPSPGETKPQAGLPPGKAEPPAQPAPAPPSELGRIRLGQGDSLPRLLQTLYGSSGQAQMQALTKANPQHPDLSRISEGATLVLPAIPAAASPLAPEKVWVQMARKSTLAEALRLLAVYPNDMPPVRLVPCWNPREGLAFLLVLKTGFPSLQKAQAAMEHLPSGVKILEKADPGTVYFAQ